MLRRAVVVSEVASAVSLSTAIRHLAMKVRIVQFCLSNRRADTAEADESRRKKRRVGNEATSTSVDERVSIDSLFLLLADLFRTS
jgi:hypothetical protein